MKTKQITVDVYEVGDLVDVSEVLTEYEKNHLSKAQRAVVIAVRERKNGMASYNVLTNEAKNVKVSADDMEKGRYIGHIDLSMLLGDGENA